MFDFSKLHPIFTNDMLGYTLSHYSNALGLFIVLSIGFLFLKYVTVRYIAALANATVTDLDNTFVDIVRAIPRKYVYFLSFFLSLRLFELPAWVSQTLFVVVVFWTTLYLMKILNILIQHMSRKHIDAHNHVKGAVGMITVIIQGVLWTIATVLVLSNLGINVTSLITGLGIGGIAVALALQNILGDLFSYFAIHLDQPFAVGDYVVVGNTTGHITKIGIRTTRIKSLTGNEVVVSNKEITSSQIKNYKRLERRRIQFSLGVTYDTTLAQLKQIPVLVENIISKVDNVTFERCHFRKFGDYAQHMDVVYFVESKEFRAYVDANQEILLGVKEVFGQEGIGFAFPTQTLYVEKGETT